MYRKLLVLGVVCFWSIAAVTDTNYRLNTPIVPSQYNLLITPYFATNDSKQFTFNGRVSMQFTTNNRTNQIQLHSEDLNYTVADINLATTGVTIVLNSSNPLVFDSNYTFAYINLQNELEIGVEYTLTIQYTGLIREDLKGFYRNYYWENGIKKWLGATQMEPTHARKVFPCLDEPGYKAEFQISVERPSSFQPSLTNTEIQSIETASIDGYVREVFYPTPKMSTYLVAFLVSEFDAAMFSKNGTREFGIYVRPEAKSQANYSYEFGIKVEEALSVYFGIDYYSTNSHLRLDHVGLPDFSAGAMENWGLIKYRESLLLYVPDVSSPYYKYRVAQIMAHETTHMWFGNLVTCHWWSDTWLNEGFANYFQDYITAFVDPEVGSANMLVIGSVYSAYDADNYPTSPPITNINVNSPAEISAHFGTITYQKAGSVIRMIHHLIQDEAFKYGLNYYLNNNSLSSGYPDKLYSGLTQGVTAYNALSSFPGASVADVMGSWITQAGYPILHVNIDYTTETVTLTQKRFYADSSYSSNETYNIPISYTTQLAPNFENTKPNVIMYNQTYEFQIANISNAHSWVIFNIQETGLYRVNYDDHSWSIISSALKGNDSNEIHHLNRAKIVNDLFAFLHADEVTFSTLYNVLDFLPSETQFTVWYAALKGFNKLWYAYLGDSETLPYVQDYVLKFLDMGVSRFGYEVRSTDNFEDLKNRMQILEFACKLGHEGCIENSVSLFKALRQNGTEVTPSLRPVVYCNGLRHGNEEDYDFLWNRLLTTNVANEASVIENALGCTASEDRLKSYLLSRLLENTPIRYQDMTVPLASVLSNYGHLNIVMDSLKNNYTVWSTIYPSMDTIVSTVASTLHSDNDFSEFEAWLSTCTECTEEVKTAANNSLKTAKATRTWAANHKVDILKSLKSDSTMAAPSLLLTILLSFALLFTKN